MRNNIALVTMDYAPERGGVARYLSNLVEASHGQMDVFVPEGHQMSGPGTMEQARFFCRGFWRWRPLIGLFRSLGRRGYKHVLISHVLPVGTAAWIAQWFGGPSYTVIIHGLDLRLAHVSRKKTWLVRHILRKAFKVITPSEATAMDVRNFDQPLDPRVLTPGVEKIVFPSRETSRRRWQVLDTDIVLLAVARLVPRKGIDRLIECMAHLPEQVRLVVVGDGADRKRLEGLMAGLEARILFTGDLSDQDRNTWYAAADVFVLPVRDEGSDVEGFGIVYLEAALAGLPVMAGASGGAREAIVDGQTGFLVDPNDVPMMVETLFRFVRGKELRERLGSNGRERVERDFCWEDRWNLFVSWFDR